MLMSFKRGQTGIIVRVKILDSAATTGAGKTGLTSASAGLIISTFADVESAATAYTQAAGNIETIATLGTFVAPTSGKCRFKEVDATNHKGVYEIQIADARFAVANSKSLLISISGASGAAECDVVIPLWLLDPYSAKVAATIAAGDIATDALNAAALAADAVAEIQNGLATATALTSVANKVAPLPSDPADASDIANAFTALTTLINAVKAKTDIIPAQPAAVGSAMVLATDGLDDVNVPQLSSPPDFAGTVTLLEILSLVGMWYVNPKSFNKNTLTIQLKNAAGTTIMSQSVADDGTTRTHAKAT